MLGTRGRAKRVAVRPEAAHGALPPLPLPLVLAVADHLPADDKLRLAFVSPAFRALADKKSLYQDVRLSAGSGVGRASDSLLQAISAKARGTMRTLDVSGRVGGHRPVISVDAVAAVCTASADTLQAVDARCKDELNDWLGSFCLKHDDVAELLASAPLLLRLYTDLSASAAQAQAMLSHTVVRVRRLSVNGFDDAASVVALVTVLAAHPSLTQLQLCRAPLGATVALDAVVGFAVERRLGALRFTFCSLGVDSMPALARLLEQGTGLSALTVDNSGVWLPVSAAFCAALRACTLTRLELSECRLFDGPGGLALLAAAAAHPALQHLCVEWTRVAEGERPAVGAALGALVGANAAALTSLNVENCDLGDEGLRPLVAALPGNSALRSLRCGFNDVSRPIAASLLSAVRANTSLRLLSAKNGTLWVDGEFQEPYPELAEAEALVAARG